MMENNDAATQGCEGSQMVYDAVAEFLLETAVATNKLIMEMSKRSHDLPEGVCSQAHALLHMVYRTGTSLFSVITDEHRAFALLHTEIDTAEVDAKFKAHEAQVREWNNDPRFTGFKVDARPPVDALRLLDELLNRANPN